ncbi:hypothetical protein TNCV_1106261 [Trichonephila clavipes]|nr:hypothetical protein TNCV_1106261 [Trichonephila clavipes]
MFSKAVCTSSHDKTSPILASIRSQCVVRSRGRRKSTEVEVLIREVGRLVLCHSIDAYAQSGGTLDLYSETGLCPTFGGYNSSCHIFTECASLTRLSVLSIQVGCVHMCEAGGKKKGRGDFKDILQDSSHMLCPRRLVVRARRENAVKTGRVEQAVVSRRLPKNYSSRSYESSLDGAASECIAFPARPRHDLLAIDLVTWQAMVGRHILEDIGGRVAQYVDEHYPVDKWHLGDLIAWVAQSALKYRPRICELSKCLEVH